jgi:BirA family biotin operon repressor/biotin-[acetyl-CoA-carboxylase] ligase
LISKGDLIVLKKIKNGLRTDFVGQKIYHFTEVTSTNDVAKELALEGAEEGTIVISETQSRGRGRLGRKWFSPEGGIWFSVILCPKMSPKHAPKITFALSIAMAKTIIKMFRLKVKVRWPNDVLINNKKVCGILTELSSKSGAAIDFIVSGIGINANTNMKSFPKALRESLTSLEEQVRRKISREAFLKALFQELEHYYKMLTKCGFAQILREWKSLTDTLNSYVEVTSFDEKVKGQAIDVDQDGALLIRLEDGSIKKVMSGDASVCVQKR